MYQTRYRFVISGRKPRRSMRQHHITGVVSQNYEEIKRNCLARRTLFEDPEFPAESSSLYYSQPPKRRVEWKRPKEICPNPQWIDEGASRFDVVQGELDDCWMIAAVASLTCDQKLFSRVVPPDQSFQHGYCGAFRFRLWYQGEWLDVVVDDRLPTYRGQLIYMHSDTQMEFWSALLEKAYAKLHGSFESLKGGSAHEAMEDFTGGLAEVFSLKEWPANLLQIMLKSHERSALMACSIDYDGQTVDQHHRLDNGLIVGHAYSLTSIRQIDVDGSGNHVTLVRVRNPWGNDKEWNGAWSDRSQEWERLPQHKKESLGLTFDDDGEFWMNLFDFLSHFSELEICNLDPVCNESAVSVKRWEVTTHTGSWVKHVSAGGCRGNHPETFWTNPQFRVTLTDPDETDDEDECTVIVALLQKDRRKKRQEGVDLLQIGYIIYQLKNNHQGPLDKNFFLYNASVAKSPPFINRRETCGRHKLLPGNYVIIPSTFNPNQEGDFLLRIFTEKAKETQELDEETRFMEIEIHTCNLQALVGGPNALTQPSDSPPPPTSADSREQEERLARFRTIAGDDMEVDAYELQEVLNFAFTKKFVFPGFSIDVCRSMVALHDGDLSGKLGFEEFRDLWADLKRWEGVFREYDIDRSGSFNSYELRLALNSVGFRLSNRTFQSIVMRYSNKTGQIEFGDFIVCAVRLKTMIEAHRTADFNKIDNFIQTTMYS
ncbi:calpain-B-like isoform X1 [Haliotis rufescens]|uniref:calpain-B-like isoform X1 n=1 Tax=Haliotis rufescens TaxID=6454 RepID=UPI001EB024FA|nr:calpain-B-like isoform X1 [Haliotis rufescens]